MKERDAFLSAIRSSPDDHTAQLAFADWLDEHSDGERAELCRVRVELARRATMVSPPGCRPFCIECNRASLAGSRHTPIRDGPPCVRCGELRARARDLESRLSRWPCERCRDNGRDECTPRSDVCRDCGGSGDVLRTPTLEASHGYSILSLPLTWRGGYVVGVTVPRVLFEMLEGGEEFRDTFHIGADVIRLYPTPDAAKLALGKAIAAIGRKAAGVTPPTPATDLGRRADSKSA
jgi:uncharacterized protein (TIGR02996 family)